MLSVVRISLPKRGKGGELAKIRIGNIRSGYV